MHLRAIWRCFIPAVAAAGLVGCATPSPIQPDPPDETMARRRVADTDAPEPVGKDILLIEDLPAIAPYPRNASIPDKADWIHDATFLKLQHVVGSLDQRFVEDVASKEPVPASRFRIGAFVEVIDRDTFEFALDPEFEMDVNLPNAERKLNLFVTTRELDELPSTDPTDVDRSLKLGLSRLFFNHFRFSIGTKVDLPPEVFGKLLWNREWRAGSWQVYPGWSTFWESEDGFGTTGSLTWDRWKGRGLFRTATGARWTEVSDGVEWDQTFILGYSRELLEERKLGRRARGRDVANGGGLRYSVGGHDSGSFQIDLHRLTLFYKFPLRKRWMYFVIAPEVSFLNDRDWDADPGIKAGLDMLFWGVGDR